jgi:hypothetical protein
VTVARKIAKTPAHDRWACVDCRWSVKLALLDIRTPSRPSYACPKCGHRMLWTGTAFRPPRRDDDEGWRVAARILAAGHRFRATRARKKFPRTPAEVDRWLELQATGREWLAEKPLSVETPRGGGVRVRAGRRTIVDGEPILVLYRGHWTEGRVRYHGDGHTALATPLVKLSRTSVALTARTRARVQRQR